MQLEFFTALLQDREKELLPQIKEEWFDIEGRQVLKFIREYSKMTGDFPTVLTVERELDLELPEVSEPVIFWLNKIKEKYQELVTKDAIEEAARKKSLQPFFKALKRLSVNSSIDNYYEGALKRWEGYLKRKELEGIDYLPTGDAYLDKIFYGYTKGDYILIGGGEGAGKTWWLLRRANDLNKKVIHTVESEAKGKNILFFSIEMTKAELKERLDAMNAKINYKRLVWGKLTAEEEERYYKTLQKQERLKEYDRLHFITDAFSMREIESYVIAYEPAIIFIDGIHLFSKSFDWKDLMTVSKQLRQLALYYEIPVVVTAHLKKVEGLSPEKATTESFAYFKGARDASIAGVLISTPEMKLSKQVSLTIVKGRKGQQGSLIYQNDYDTSGQVVLDSDFEELEELHTEVLADSEGDLPFGSISETAPF